MNVVVTGVGVVSAFGSGLAVLEDGLRAHRVATRSGPLNEALGVPCVAEVPDGSPGPDRRIDFALSAARECLASASSPDSMLDADATSGSAPGPTALAAHDAILIACGVERAMLPAFDPLWDGTGVDFERAAGATPPLLLRGSVDAPVRAVCEALGHEGPAFASSNACAGGVIALLRAARWVRSGRAERVLCGAADSMIDPMGLGGMLRLGTLSASGVCRPFDARRDGLVMGEGAAMFLVESERSARARGATVWAHVLGGGVTQDAYRPSAPHPEGRYAEAAMRVALRDHDGSSVDYVNAHGTGTPLNDVAEATAIRRAVGEAALVSSIKGAIGHAMAASGAIEIAACLLALREGLVPGTAGLETVDHEIGPLNLVQAPQETPLRRVLCNAFGFGGQNASVLLGTSR